MLQWFIAVIVSGAYDGSPLLRHPLWMTGVRSFAALAEELRARPGPVQIVGIDGRAGSGKTTFAERLARALGDAPVVHTDDFATQDDLLDWWPRLLAEVVEPLLDGRPATYRPYEWVPRTYGEPVTVEPRGVVLIEGVRAASRAWRSRLATRVWVDAPAETRRRRTATRGDGSADFWRDWTLDEDRYLDAEQPQDHADLVVDGDPQEPLDADREFCVLSAPRAADAPPR